MTNQNIPKNHEEMDLFTSHKSDEIDLRELISVIWRGKWVIAVITLIFAISSVFYAVKLPNIYKSEALLAPVSQDGNDGGLSGLASQFGGLASMAGINIGGGSADQTTITIEILKSRKFISEFIEKHELLPELMALSKWDMETNTLNYNTNIYNPITDMWSRDAKFPFTSKPSMQEAYAIFMQMLTVNVLKDSGMVVISIESISPYLAKQWVSWLVEDINKEMKARDVLEATRSTSFLEQQILKTNVADIRNVLYKLIEEQAKTIMFANVRDEYAFKIIDPAIVPQVKEEPNRAIISIIGTLTGGFLGIMIVLLRYFVKE